MKLSLIEITEKREKLNEEIRLEVFQKNEIIPMAENTLWLVERGVVQLALKKENNKKVVLGWAYPKRFFSRWLGCSGNYYAQALSDVYLRRYHIEEIDNNPILARKILSQVVSQIKQAYELLAIASDVRAGDRLMKLLKMLAESTGSDTAKGRRINIYLTHKDLASAISTTRVTVTRILGEFRDLGSIEVDRDRHITIIQQPTMVTE